MLDQDLRKSFLSKSIDEAGKDPNASVSSPLKRLSKQYLKQAADFWNEDFKWKERRRIAIDFLRTQEILENSEDYIFLLAYCGDIEAFTKAAAGLTHSIKHNMFGLTPLIYSIWGEIDRAETETKLSSALLLNYIKKENDEGKSEEEKGKIVFEHIDKELGHAFAHGILPPDYSDFTLIEQDYSFSLQYLIEENLFDLTFQDNISQIGWSAKNSARCNNVIMKYLIDHIKNLNFSDDTNFEIMSFLEKDFKFVLTSSSKYLHELLDILILSSRQQLQVDSEDFPLIKLLDCEGSLSSVKSEAISLMKFNTPGENIINAEIYSSAIRFPSIHGSKESLNLLKSITNYSDSKIFRSRIIQYYLKYKWDSIWFFILLQTLLIWSNLPLMFFMIFHEDPSIYLIIAFISVNSLLAIVEILQIISMGVFQYFGDLQPAPGTAVLTIVCLVVFPCLGLNEIALCSYLVLQLYIFSSTRESTFL